MSKHTKGPWMVKEKPFCISVESEDDILSDLYLSDEDDAYAREHRAICYANARLIAAAPELYDELVQADAQMQMAYECVEAGRHDEALLHLAAMSRTRRAAIAKARGKS